MKWSQLKTQWPVMSHYQRFESAVARKFVILDLHEVGPAEMLGLAAVALALGVTYWLIRDRDEPR